MVKRARRQVAPRGLACVVRERAGGGPWPDVVGHWLPRLAPGIAAAGTHAAIRAGPTVCSLEARENAACIDELARGLAYWAAGFMELPGFPGGTGSLAPSRALWEIELLPNERRTGRVLITNEMADLPRNEPFSKSIYLVACSASSPGFMADLLATFAGVYVNTPNSTFSFLHAVAGSASMRELLPFVTEADRGDVQVTTWQVTAGIIARYARPGLVAKVDADVDTGSDAGPAASFADRAVASGEEHTIKLAAACLREWRRNPDPHLLAAAGRRIRGGG